MKRYFGSYKITRKLSDVTFKVEPVDQPNRRRQIRDLVNVLRMKPYHDPEDQADLFNSRSFSKPRSHNSTCEASAAEISSASVDERDTQPCFPVIHEMGFDLSRSKFPLIDFLSVLSLAHVASLYASSVGGFWLDMRSSSSLVVFRYLTIIFAAFQSQFLGFWFLLLSMQTGAAISGLDTTLRYNSEPISCWYWTLFGRSFTSDIPGYPLSMGVKVISCGITASAHRDCGSPESNSMHLVISISDRFFLSATPFWA
ncbi:hypothetical protein LAZ67_11000928, partial [Cordylochernes scorpioides]